MPKESNKQNLFFKKSLTRHLAGAGGHHSTSDHSEKSTPTASEDEAGTRSSRGPEQRETGDTEETVSQGEVASEQASTEERGANIRSERFQAALNDSENEGESSVSTSSEGRDHRMTDSKTSKRQMKPKKEYGGRGSYPQRGSYPHRSGKSSDRRDSGRMGYYPRGPRPLIPFPHHGRPPPPPHILEHLSQSPRDSAFMGPISSPRRTPRHSESSSCGSPLHYSGHTPPQSPRAHFYESPIHSPLRQHFSPFNSPPRHSVSPIPRMMPPEVMHAHHAMLPPQHALPSIPVPMQPPEMGIFSGTPPQQFHPMNNPHMRPLTPEQHQMVAAMQHRQQQQQQKQRLAAEQQLEQLKLKQAQESAAQMVMQMQAMANQGQNITMTPEQLNQLQWHMSQQPNIMPGPGGQGILPQQWMQQGAPHPEMMLNPIHQPNPIPQPNPEMPPRLLQSGPMAQQMHPFFVQAQIQQQQLQQQQHQQQLQQQQQLQLQQQQQTQLQQQQQPQLQQHQLPGFAGHHNMPFNMNQMMEHNQPVMVHVPQPIHPEMGNPSRITPPQNYSSIDPSRMQNFSMQPRHFASPTQTARQVPSPNIPLSPPRLPSDDIEPVTISAASTEPSAVNVEPVKSQDDLCDLNNIGNIPTTTKTEDVPVTTTQIEIPAKPPCTTPETPTRTCAKTPGLIRLPPPKLPTEEEMLKSPDSGTPVNMKKNYWQKRQKSTESTEQKGEIELPELLEGGEKDSHEVPANESSATVPGAEKAKESVSKADTASSDTPVLTETADTPKKSSGKNIKPKGFNLSDLGDLVTSTVKHNSNIPKTDIGTSCSGSTELEVVLNEGMRRAQSPCLAGASERERHHSRDGDNWRPLSRETKVDAAANWRAQDSPATSSRGAEEDPVQRKEALREAESKELSTGQQIQYAIGKLNKSSGQRTASESSSKSVKDLVEVEEEAWYNEEDEELIDCFDLTI